MSLATVAARPGFMPTLRSALVSCDVTETFREWPVDIMPTFPDVAEPAAASDVAEPSPKTTAEAAEPLRRATADAGDPFRESAAKEGAEILRIGVTGFRTTSIVLGNAAGGRRRCDGLGD